MRDTIKKITIQSDNRLVAITHEIGTSPDETKNDQGVDVIVELNDRSKYVASFFLYEKLVHEIAPPQAKYDGSYHRYFWRKNMIMVNDFKSETIEDTIHDLMDEGDFLEAFEKIHRKHPLDPTKSQGTA